MKIATGILFPGLLLLTACHTAEEAAVTTFKVVDAPANYVRHRIDESEAHPTTGSSDVVTPGRPVEPSPTPATSRRQTVTSTERNASAPTTSTQHESSSAPSRTTASSQNAQQFPTAKPVPGKPGFVYSPYDPNGGYVDVTGYPSGSKAKDPYSQKIFIVP